MDCPVKPGNDKIKGMLVRILASLLFFAAPAPAFAWSADGHRAICMIAWEQMTDPAKAGVFGLLGISSEKEFVDACVWADQVAATRPEVAAWHGLSLPSAARDIDMARDCPAKTSCSVAQVERFAAVLKSAAPKTEKAEALKFLAHLVGELHQPLNIGFTDHLSGRQISGMFHGRPSNLHAVWDEGLLATFVSPGKDAAKVIFEVSAWTGRLYGADKKTPVAWANETLWVTVAPPTGYLGNQGGDFFGERYIRQNRSIALEQIDKAGVRLADMLNEALK
jgi:hypothetical protein